MRLPRSFRPLALALALSWPAAALAGDEDALRLVGLGEGAPPDNGAKQWHLLTEGAAGFAEADNYARFSLDFRGEAALAEQWRATLADRVDWSSQLNGRGVNTLKEAYLGWTPAADMAADLGWVNVRQGVAAGYNPTDFFRSGAVRSVVSINPESLRVNRQGSFVLQGQKLWDHGAVSALAAPPLRVPNGDTGGRAGWRGLLSGGARFGDGLQSQALLLQQESMAPQLGLNVSALVNDAVTAHVEWSGGRRASLLERALGQDGPGRWRNSMAAGGSYTAENRLSLTVEYEWSEAALDKQSWSDLAARPDQYWAYRDYVLSEQELMTSSGLFVQAIWPEAFDPKVDLSALTRIDLNDYSWLFWSELRWRLTEFDLALQWTYREGDAYSVYGAGADKQAWQVVAKKHF